MATMDDVYYVKPAKTHTATRGLIVEIYHAIDAKGGAATAADIVALVAKSGVVDRKTGKPYPDDEVRKCIDWLVREGRLIER